MTTTTVAAPETTEVLAEITNDVLAHVEAYRDARKEIRILEEARDKARDEILAVLTARGLTGYTHEGKVVARVSVVHTPRVDSKTLKQKFPAIWAKVSKISVSVRVSVED